MMTQGSKRLFQYAFMIAVGFCCGVLSFRFTSIDQAKSVMILFDQRVLTLQPELIATIVPVAISFVIVLLFSTHPYFYTVAVLFITIKSVFFGFSSVYILDEWSRMDLYVKWWFPFQLVYILLMILLYKVSRAKSTWQKTKKQKTIPIVLILVAAVVYLESFIISYVFS